MYAHGYLMFPDYIAIGMLIGNVVFLISLMAYAIRNASVRIQLNFVEKNYQRIFSHLSFFNPRLN